MIKLSEKAIKFINTFERLDSYTKDRFKLNKYFSKNQIDIPENVINFHIEFSGIKYIVGLDGSSYTELNLFNYHSDLYGWHIEKEIFQGQTLYICGLKVFHGGTTEIYLNDKCQIYINWGSSIEKLANSVEEMIETAALEDENQF